jgi:biopolymer transport protein ExbB/TolQ
MSSRIFLLVLVVGLVAAPGAALALNRFAKWVYAEVVATQRQVDQLDARPHRPPAQTPEN